MNNNTNNRGLPNNPPYVPKPTRAQIMKSRLKLWVKRLAALVALGGVAWGGKAYWDSMNAVRDETKITADNHAQKYEAARVAEIRAATNKQFEKGSISAVDFSAHGVYVNRDSGIPTVDGRKNMSQPEDKKRVGLGNTMGYAPLKQGDPRQMGPVDPNLANIRVTTVDMTGRKSPMSRGNENFTVTDNGKYQQVHVDKTQYVVTNEGVRSSMARQKAAIEAERQAQMKIQTAEVNPEHVKLAQEAGREMADQKTVKTSSKTTVKKQLADHQEIKAPVKSKAGKKLTLAERRALVNQGQGK